jgi:hypothetical protein
MKSLLLSGAALLSLLAAGAAYAVGLVDGHLLDQRAERTFCGAKPLSHLNPYGGSDMFPLSQKCRWSDGTTTELVPSYVNPLVLVLLALTVLFVVLTIRAAWRPPRALTGLETGEPRES